MAYKRQERCRGWLLLFSLCAAFGAFAWSGSVLNFSILLFLCALTTFSRLPLPIGDPLFVLLAGNALGIILICLVLGCWQTLHGSPIAGILFFTAAAALVYNRLTNYHAVEEIRASFAEAGITYSSQDMALQELQAKPPPLAMRMLPLCAICLRDDTALSSGVTLRRFGISTEDPSRYVDVWFPSQGGDHRDSPVFFFIHGGSWKGMKPRCNAAMNMLHSVAAAGWVAVACSYRKKSWPQHIDDAFAALSWTVDYFGTGGKPKNLVVAGNSAGGHLAVLVTLRALQHDIDVNGCVLGYPAVDPYDEDGLYASLPFAIHPLQYQRGQSVLAWFFERFVLQGRSELWDGARPLLQTWAKLPPALVIHGSLDSIVPVEQSRGILARLQSSRDNRCMPADLLLEVNGARHSFDIVHDARAKAVHAGVVAWLRCILSAPPA
eukprot:TRINITY_DN39618_c0_g1_i2.p1 TRINITY_DN39618_c0_g1~~TRINITY_DN39618_c0_g1_i2.p1  ORF type:complete len:436 (+),score=51.84 TRINITY_DN39618_c0_g1_i2:44-1351(+)